jgi:hypothetical protein
MINGGRKGRGVGIALKGDRLQDRAEPALQTQRSVLERAIILPVIVAAAFEVGFEGVEFMLPVLREHQFDRLCRKLGGTVASRHFGLCVM